MTEYLTIEDALHVVRRYGFHVRDAGLLASALARPSASFSGNDAYPTLAGKAAALLESSVRNHALADGNKRTGWTLMVLFLWINGCAHDFTDDEGFTLVMGVAGGATGLEQSGPLIAAHQIGR